MNWLRKFMLGRYGVDQLSVGLLFLSFLLSIIMFFIPSSILSYVIYLPILVFLFRVLSKNHTMRRKENAAFLKLWNPVYLWFGKKHTQMGNRKTHRYFKCPGCKQEMRVPKGKGKIRITCPKCKLEFIKKT